jgi:YidC/Oxa1 family membrane protein insertase
MERRLLLVFALTFLVIILFQPVLKKYLPQPPPPTPQSQTKAQPAPAMSQPSAPPPPPEVESQAPSATKQASTEAETTIENDLYKIVFTNRGAHVKSWVLKKYEDEKHQPLELVNAVAAEKYGYPLSLWIYDETLRHKLKSALYVASASGWKHAPTEVTFEYADQNVEVRKSFHFDQTYVVQVETSVRNNGRHVAAFPMWPGGFGDETNSASYAAGKIEYHNNESTERNWLFIPKKTQRLSIKEVSGGNTVRGPFNWGGVSDQYFAAVFIPEDAQNSGIVTLRNSVDIPKDASKPNPQEMTKVDVLGAAVGDLQGPTVERMFVGPKALNVLESITVTGGSDHNDLRELVNFGTFSPIARPLFLWLKWTYSYVHNWGWAIVIQTFIIAVALLPLRISSMKSALKMQKIQPQMNAIKEKYKKYSMRDPRRQEMNQEIANLMKREKVSPAGGCLPLLIQMPFIFAYYSMLGAAIELRHASWLWISDLSSRDPFFLLPVALVVSMVATQRMTPQGGMDPAQQKMMNWTMPLMMGFIFFNLASGLNLYYAESNLIAIAQQAIMNRTKLGQEMRELAQKRARKKEK